jgi:hypothetical protein
MMLISLFEEQILYVRQRDMKQKDDGKCKMKDGNNEINQAIYTKVG